MELSARELAGRALDLLASRLDSIIEARLAPALQGLEWTALLTEMDRLKGKTPGIYSRRDVQAQLRILTERLGQLGYPLDDHRRIVSTLGSELRIVRNHVAHQDDMDVIDAWRAADFVVRLLDYFGDQEGVSASTALRDNVMRLDQPDVDVVDEEDDDAGTDPDPEEAEDVAVADREVVARPASASTTVLGGERQRYEPWPVARLGDLSVLDNLRVRKHSQAVRAAVQEIVEFEGPVHEDRAAQLVGQAFGLNRVRGNRVKPILHQVKNSSVQQDAHGFLWPEGVEPTEWREFRPHTDGERREFDRISPFELANAARVLTQLHPMEDRESLERRVMKTFGFQRRTAKVKRQLAACWLVLSSEVRSS